MLLLMFLANLSHEDIILNYNNTKLETRNYNTSLVLYLHA